MSFLGRATRGMYGRTSAGTRFRLRSGAWLEQEIARYRHMVRVEWESSSAKQAAVDKAVAEGRFASAEDALSKLGEAFERRIAITGIGMYAMVGGKPVTKFAAAKQHEEAFLEVTSTDGFAQLLRSVSAEKSE